MSEHRSVTMYSVCPFDKILRTDFQLPYDPYYLSENKSDPREQRAAMSRELLGRLGVIFYRDSSNAQGVITQPTKIFEGDVPRIELNASGLWQPLEAIKVWVYRVEVEYPVITPLEWPYPDNASQLPMYQRFKDKWGDSKRWLTWGGEEFLREMSASSVSCLI